MKTIWFGAQILAETEEDKRILNSLVSSLPKENIESYDHASIYAIDKNSYSSDGIWMFEVSEVEKAKMTIQINR